MTRINCVPVGTLCDQHLVAEYRELPRIFGLVTNAILRGERPDEPRNPAVYTLGEGHCRFFYSRLLFLHWRHIHICNELVRRGFKPQFTQSLRGQWERLIPTEWWGDWKPSVADILLNAKRIKDRMPAKPRFSRR